MWDDDYHEPINNVINIIDETIIWQVVMDIHEVISNVINIHEDMINHQWVLTSRDMLTYSLYRYKILLYKTEFPTWRFEIWFCSKSA